MLINDMAMFKIHDTTTQVGRLDILVYVSIDCRHIMLKQY